LSDWQNTGWSLCHTKIHFLLSLMQLQNKPAAITRLFVLPVVATLMFSTYALSQVKDATAKSADSPAEVATLPRSSVVIRVPLPITPSTRQKIERALQTAAAEAAARHTIATRPVVMLEFETTEINTGASSDLTACFGLARLLTSPAMARIQTIAYISANRAGRGDPSDRGALGSPEKINGQLNGHAVLVAIACSEIVMEYGTAIGNAGAGEEPVDAIVANIYKDIASRRYALPVEVVLSMLENDRGLFRVTTPEKIIFASAQQLGEIENAKTETITLAPANQRALLTSEKLAEFRLISHRVKSKSDLARKLNLAADQLNIDASDGGQWKAISIKVPEFLDRRTARWIIRSVKPAVAYHKANLLLLEMDDSVGDLEAGVDLARMIAEFDSADVRTVAVINDSARSGSAFAALACDQIVIQQSATLGGFEPAAQPGDSRPNSVSSNHRSSYLSDAKSIAAEKERDWSVLAAMIDAEIEIARYRNPATGDARLLSVQEWESLEDSQQWELSGLVDTTAGIKANPLKQLAIASNVIQNPSDIESIFQLSAPPKVLAPTSSDRWIQSLASFLTSPTISSLLIMGAFFFISTEMSAPGLGVPGFLGTLCLVAFFWAQYFDGNAEWFEILLFGIGIAFILMEVFVIPGFGIFGIGGILMVCAAIVLAAQSFLVPLNARDVEKLPNSLFPLAGAGFGILIAVLVLPRLIPDTPFLKNVILAPPKKPELDLANAQDSEATANLDYLMGQKGVAATKLMPSGRAQFGDQICDVITRGQVVEKGEAIEVIEAVANRVVVKKVSA
jgi:membrane-bound ClpP family serine protease